MKYTILAISVLLYAQCMAQQPLNNAQPQRLYEQAMHAYSLGAFSSAQSLLAAYLQNSDEHSEEAAYYMALAQVKSGSPDGVGSIAQFVEQNPSHPLAAGAYYELGNYYFDKDEHAKALSYYEKVQKSNLPQEEQEEWLFKKGYIVLMDGDLSQSQSDLLQANSYRGAYFDKSSYYLAVIYTRNKQYPQALGHLEAMTAPDELKDDVVTLTAGIYYSQKKYDRLISYAEPQLTNTANDKNLTLHKLLGEAYFDKLDYPKAAKHLKRFVDMSRRRVDGETYYKLGIASFENGQKEDAVQSFKVSGLEKGNIGQGSSYYLGQLYMGSNNLNYAYSAFKNATEEGDNQAMAEEAAFTLGKINFERGQYAESVRDFNSFIKNYPNSRWLSQSNELLAQAYLKSSDYDQAIAHLESIRNKTSSMKKAYQKVTFQKAQLLYNDQRFGEALRYFARSVEYTPDTELAAQGYYLKGECHALLREDDQAISAYRSSLRLGTEFGNLSRYGLAYQHYNDKDFKAAAGYFEQFIQNSFRRSDFTIDARMRLADCYYVQKRFDEAINNYSQVEPAVLQPYVKYQIGLCYKLKDDVRQATSYFKEALSYSNGDYQDDALFQLGQMNVESSNFQVAAPYFARLITDYPSSKLAPYAKGRLALAYSNISQYDKARDQYMDILENHLNHEVANAALLGLQELVNKGVKVKDFDKYVEGYRLANPDDKSLEVIAFERAKSAYFDQTYEEAIGLLGDFMQKYPKSSFQQDALYFQADAYYRLSKWKEAVAAFDVLIGAGASSYLNRSLDKRGKALMAIGNSQKAIANYRMLLSTSNNLKETYIANEGLMTAYLSQERTDSALYFADKLETADWKPPGSDANVWMVKGKIYLAKKSYSKAQDEFLKVLNAATNEQGAEAKYLIGKAFYLQGENKRSLEVLFDLNKSFGSYPFWIGKSFLLIADNYLVMGELLQAKATTQSIIENATNKNIVVEAKSKLEKIKSEEAKILAADTTTIDSIK